MSLTADVVMPALNKVGLPFFTKPGDEDTLLIVLHLERQAARVVHVFVFVDEESQEVHLWAPICKVPPPHRGRVALVLAELTAETPFVKWGLFQDWATALLDVELGFGGARQAACEFALQRLIALIMAHWARLLQTSGRRTAKTRLERELEALLARRGVGDDQA